MARRTEVGVPYEPRREDGSGLLEEGLLGNDRAVFAQVLGETVEILETERIPYALIGGIASGDYGRPRWTHDIDVFVRPRDAERVIEALGRKGFVTEKTDPRWIFKAFKEKVMVDVIFRSGGGFFLDQQMLDRSVTRDVLGRRVRFIPPEDLIVIKAVAHDETGARHWHDALGVIAVTKLDWDYLLLRARRSPRRTLSLLVYAQSLDLYVPDRVIRSLYRDLYES